jgi:hypothetical protein
VIGVTPVTPRNLDHIRILESIADQFNERIRERRAREIKGLADDAARR